MNVKLSRLLLAILFSLIIQTQASDEPFKTEITGAGYSSSLSQSQLVNFEVDEEDEEENAHDDDIGAFIIHPMKLQENNALHPSFLKSDPLVSVDESFLKDGTSGGEMDTNANAKGGQVIFTANDNFREDDFNWDWESKLRGSSMDLGKTDTSAFTSSTLSNPRALLHSEYDLKQDCVFSEFERALGVRERFMSYELVDNSGGDVSFNGFDLETDIIGGDASASDYKPRGRLLSKEMVDNYENGILKDSSNLENIDLDEISVSKCITSPLALQSPNIEDSGFWITVESIGCTPVSSECDESDDDAEGGLESRHVDRINDKWIEEKLIPFLRAGNMISESYFNKILDKMESILIIHDTIHAIWPQNTEKIVVVGDIHGQFEDLLKIFEICKDPTVSILYLFNGDIVDRGPNSLACLLVLFARKISNPFSTFITRGNHESMTCGDGSFRRECCERIDATESFFYHCHHVFQMLPLGYILGGKVFVCHGGIPDNFLISQLQFADRMNFTAEECFIVMALLWNDPHDGDGMAPSIRGPDMTCFGRDVTLKFLDQHGLSLLVRSHQVAHLGRTFHHDDKCITIFSAPNYCGMNNRGAVLIFDSHFDYVIKEIC